MSLPDVTELHGLPVFDFPSPDEADDKPLPPTDAVAWRISRSGLYDDEEGFDDCWNRFFDILDVSRVRALVLGAGAYGTDLDAFPAATVERLVAAADRLTGLEALYLADVEPEIAELSWIVQADVSPILAAYPRLRELCVRGGSDGDEGEGEGDSPTGLRFPPLRHEGLRTLRFHSGGLPGAVVRGVAASDLPHLEHLEMWLGVEDYGGSATVADLAPILNGGRLPALRHLGLQNSEIQDEIAAAVASAPVVAQLSSLCLGRGALSDAGAEALLSGQPLAHLRRLDLRHHFLSDALMRRVRQALEPSGAEVDLSEQEKAEEEEGRYVAASE